VDARLAQSLAGRIVSLHSLRTYSLLASLPKLEVDNFLHTARIAFSAHISGGVAGLYEHDITITTHPTISYELEAGSSYLVLLKSILLFGGIASCILPTHRTGVFTARRFLRT
jgi:hypothetical protein